MSMLHKTFSKNLAKIRKQKGMSQSELAGKSGISRRAIVHYENHASQPPLDKIEILANALNTSITSLLELNVSEEDLENSNFDIRTLKRFKKLVALDRQDRMAVYKMIDALFDKQKATPPKGGRTNPDQAVGDQRPWTDAADSAPRQVR